MSDTLRDLAQRALQLSERERLELAAELIDSVEGPDRAWADVWATELDRRVFEADRSGERGESWETIRGAALERLAQKRSR
jgi:putative addiction module component (TIGR02574 family)